MLAMLVLIIVFATKSVKAGVNSVSSSQPAVIDIKLKKISSDDGRCTVGNAQWSRYEFCKYSADVFCPTLRRTKHVKAQTFEVLMREIDKAYRAFEEEMDTK